MGRRFIASSGQGLAREGADLERRGFDGLWCPTEPCGCWVSDLRPCGEFHTGCRGGVECEQGIGPREDGVK